MWWILQPLYSNACDKIHFDRDQNVRMNACDTLMRENDKLLT